MGYYELTDSTGYAIGKQVIATGWRRAVKKGQKLWPKLHIAGADRQSHMWRHKDEVALVRMKERLARRNLRRRLKK